MPRTKATRSPWRPWGSTLLQHLKGYQSSTRGDVRYDDGTTNGRALTDDEKNSALSDMLTVWRTLHLEVDSMGAPPTNGTNPQANFLQGVILSITEDAVPGVGRRATRITVIPDLPFGFLSDDSPDLDFSPRPPGANGRFENGTVWIGSGDAAVRVSGLDGNGAVYVEKVAGMDIPFTLVDKDGRPFVPRGRPGTAPTIIGWNGVDEFTVSVAVGAEGRPDFQDGQLTVGGIT